MWGNKQIFLKQLFYMAKLCLQSVFSKSRIKVYQSYTVTLLPYHASCLQCHAALSHFIPLTQIWNHSLTSFLFLSACRNQFSLPELTKLLQEVCHTSLLLCTGYYYMGTDLLEDYTRKGYKQYTYASICSLYVVCTHILYFLLYSKVDCGTSCVMFTSGQ